MRLKFPPFEIGILFTGITISQERCPVCGVPPAVPALRFLLRRQRHHRQPRNGLQRSPSEPSHRTRQIPQVIGEWGSRASNFPIFTSNLKQ